MQYSFLGNCLRANTVEAMGDTKPKLSPAECSGDMATCVCGRVVIVRGPLEVGGGERKEATQRQSQGKAGKRGSGKGRGKAQQNGPTRKLEVHVLGGSTAGDILFVEAWGI